MGIVSSVKSFFTSNEKIKGMKESGMGIISTKNIFPVRRGPGRPPGETQEPKKYFKRYRAAYKSVPIVAAAIDRTVDFVVSPGFYISSDNKEAKNICEEFIIDMDFDIFLRNVVKDMLIFGDSFVEIVEGNGGIKELKVLNPEKMRVNRTRTGTVTGYKQDLGLGSKNPEWKPDEIAHFIYNKVGDSTYGTSIIHSLLTLLKAKVEMEESMTQILKRKAGAPIHVKMGSDEFPATQDDIDAMSTDLQSLTNKTEWVTGHTVEMDVIGFKSKVLDVEPYVDHFDNQMVYGLQVPYVLLGKGRIPEGLARVQLEAMDRRAVSIQGTVEQQLERKIFKKLLEFHGISEKIEFDWGKPSQDMFTEELNQYMNLLSLNISKDTKVQIENRIRRLLHIDGEITEDDLVDEFEMSPTETKFDNPKKNDKKGDYNERKT